MQSYLKQEKDVKGEMFHIFSLLQNIVNIDVYFNLKCFLFVNINRTYLKLPVEWLNFILFLWEIMSKIQYEENSEECWTCRSFDRRNFPTIA